MQGERVKTCPECRIDKPISEFSRNASRPDGLQFYCKTCFSCHGAEAHRRRQARLGKPVRDRPEIPEGHRWCPGCHTVQPFSNWHKNRTQPSGLVSKCKDCRKAESRADHLRRTFGITVDEHDRLLAEQGGKCAVCGDDNPTHTDHDHVSGKVRGLLCGRCNLGIGLFLDDAVRMEAAMAYLGRTSVHPDAALVRDRLRRLFGQAG
jgi:Recombination endonuclease VII